MATEFSREFFADNRIVKAELRSARKPREEELNRIRAEVRKLYDATEVILNVTVDESLLSGYVLQVGDRVFDNSGRHQLDKMMEGKPSLATLKTRIEDYKPAETSAEGGVVISSADGIVHVEGMNRAVYGEIVTFDNGAKGMVESVDPEQLGIMLFDGAETVGVGTMVTRSGKRAGIPVGDAFLGRVISPLGEPIDGKGPIEAVGYNPCLLYTSCSRLAHFCCVFIRGKHPVCGEPLFCFSANPDSLSLLCGFHIDHRSRSFLLQVSGISSLLSFCCTSLVSGFIIHIPD